MKKTTSILGPTLASLILCCDIANAAPVADIDIEVNQPDGTPFTLHPKGDEWGSWYETDEGYTVIKDEQTETWHYGNLDAEKKLQPSDYVVDEDDPEESGIERHTRPAPINQPNNQSALDTTTPTLSNQPFGATGLILQPFKSAPVTGNVPTLFLLVEFTDKKHLYLDTDFSGLLANQLQTYFKEVSYGRFSTAPATESYGTANDGVVGWLSLSRLHPNSAGTTGPANQQLTIDAIKAADPYVDFAAYDLNADGYIDSKELAVVVIPAGYETAFGGTACTPSPSVWGHQWTIQSPLIAPTVDGKIVGDSHSGAGGYAQFGEIQGATAACNPNNTASIKDHQATMGIMAHELGHLILKLPDLYDTTNTSQGIGNFSLMAAGNWGFKTTDAYQGQSPVHPDPWCKIYTGWVDPIINAIGPVNLPAVGSPLATAANAVQLQTTSDSQQYFLFENRNPSGYDAGLSGVVPGVGGMIVWRVDESMRTGTTLFAPNNIKTHKFIDLVEADNVSTMDANTSRGQANDLYFSGNNTVFNDLSLPNSRLYNGVSTGIALDSVSPVAENMSAYFSLALPSQTINFSTAPTSLTVGGIGALTASASSGLSVSFSTPINNPICLISGATVKAIAPGSCSVTASQVGNASFAAAAPITKSFNVVAPKIAQTITFTSPTITSLKVKSIVTLKATAAPLLTITFSSLTPNTCSVTKKTTLTGLVAGTCTVAANQLGNATFAAAIQTTKSITITP
jgi:M6 family metalloprotease-like protein